MRSYQTLDDVFEQVEFFIDAVSGYKSDFVLFPEYFNAPLMAKFNHMGEAQSIRALAQYTEEIRDRLSIWQSSITLISLPAVCRM